MGLQHRAPRTMSLSTFDVFSQFSVHSCILKVWIRELVPTSCKILRIFADSYTHLTLLPNRCILNAETGRIVTIFSNILCSFACFHQILLLARILGCAYAEPHQVVGGAIARAYANTNNLDYVKMLPEIMHQSPDFGPFSADGSIGALC